MISLPNGTCVQIVRFGRGYVLRWRTRRMPAPAFWRFRTHRAALIAVCELA